MKLNNLEKCITLFTIILICIAGISQYRIKNNINNKIQQLLSSHSGSYHKVFPASYKKIARENKIFVDLYDNDDIILTYDFEDVPTVMNLGKDFHKDFTKRLKKENLNFKIVTYHNYEDQKREKMISEGKQGSCIMSTDETQEYDTFITDTENCLTNVCVIDNKNKRYTLINRKNMNDVINILKEVDSQTN